MASRLPYLEAAPFTFLLGSFSKGSGKGRPKLKRVCHGCGHVGSFLSAVLPLDMNLDAVLGHRAYKAVPGKLLAQGGPGRRFW